VSLSASSGVVCASLGCTALGVGLVKPSVSPRTPPHAQQDRRDKAQMCVGILEDLHGRQKCYSEVYLLGCWAPQALQTTASSPALPTTQKPRQRHMRGRARAPASAPQTPNDGLPPGSRRSSRRLTLHFPNLTRHEAKTIIAARSWESLSARSGAASATRRCTSFGVGLQKPSKTRRTALQAPQRKTSPDRSSVGEIGRQPWHHRRYKWCTVLSVGPFRPFQASTSFAAPATTGRRQKSTGAE